MSNLMNYGRLKPMGGRKQPLENKNNILHTLLYVVYGYSNEEMLIY